MHFNFLTVSGGAQILTQVHVASAAVTGVSSRRRGAAAFLI